MRKSFTRLFGVFILLSMLSLQVVAQDFSYAALNPEDGACDAEATQAFELTFDRAVKPGILGTFALNNKNGTEYVPIQLLESNRIGTTDSFEGTVAMGGTDVDWKIEFLGTKVKLDLINYTLQEKIPYYITVSENAIKDGAGNFFVGLGHDDEGVAGTLDPCVDNSPGWDFTVKNSGLFVIDSRSPAQADDEVDDQHGLCGELDFKVVFNRNIFWVGQPLPPNPMMVGHASSAYLPEDYQDQSGAPLPGYFALYESTDVNDDVYGGDVVAHMPCSVRIVANTLFFAFYDGYDLKPATTYYLRVRENLIMDQYGTKWEGFNTNKGWYFTTGDNLAPYISDKDGFEWDDVADCANDDSDIIITIEDPNNEPFYLVDTTNVVWTKTLVSNTAAMRDAMEAFITFDGNFEVDEVSQSGGTLTIVVDPLFTLADETDYNISFANEAAGDVFLMDESENKVIPNSAVLTSGDYEVDINTVYTANADGTTFDLYAKLDEPGTLHYIVLFKDEVDWQDDDNLYSPSAAQIIAGVNYSKDPNGGNAPGNKTLAVQAAGEIVMNNAGVLYHERITDLIESHGTDYDIFYVVEDMASCGDNNVAGTSSDDHNVSAIANIEESTLDILPPYIVKKQAWDDDADDNGNSNDAGYVDEDCGNTIYRWGAIKITMNEKVENADGSPITSADIDDIFMIESRNDGVSPGLGLYPGVNYGIDTDDIPGVDDKFSYYDEEEMAFYIYPDTAFKSGDIIDIFLVPGTIQDAEDETRFGPNGTELLVEGLSYSSISNCYHIEDYMGPIAKCGTTATSWYPEDGATNVADGADAGERSEIVLAFTQNLFAPDVDETTPGVLEDISTTPGDNTWIGKYIRIRKHSTEASAPIGEIVYQFDPNDPLAYQDVFSFDFENLANNSGAVATVSFDDYILESEMFYYVEIEAGLQSEDRFTLDWSDADDTKYASCAKHNYWMIFQAEDNIAPTAIFYEDYDLDPVSHVQILDGADTVKVGSYIKVSINEWVELGFPSDFTDLNPSEVIEDANALRQYFKLYAPDGSEISFDCKNFSIDFAGDVATLYIDPYGHAAPEMPNWIDGETGYQVCFLGKAGGEGYPTDDILVDDNDNGVAYTCATWDMYVETQPVLCTQTISPAVNTLIDTVTVGSNGGYFEFSITFSKAMSVVNAGATLEIMRLYDATNGLYLTNTAGASRVTGFFDVDDDGKVWTWRLPRTENVWSDGIDLELRALNDWDAGDGLVATADPSCTFGGFSNDEVIAEWSTKDLTAPEIVWFNIDQDHYGCMAERDEVNLRLKWSEPISEVSGIIEIWRKVGANQNTYVASADITTSLVNVVDDTTTVISIGTLYDATTGQICDKLMYDAEYFLQIPSGWVKDAENNMNAAMTDDDSLVFCVGPDPVAQVACADLAPLGEIQAPYPVVSITYDEPVKPVPGKRIQINESGTSTSNAVQFDVTLLESASGGEYCKTWSLDLDNQAIKDAIILLNPTFSGFEWGNCYEVNLDTAAFKDVANQGTDKIVTFTDQSNLVEYGCDWTFCLNDTEGPSVKLWPTNNLENVPVNAHLYAYIDDVPFVDTVGTVDNVNWPLVIDGFDNAEAHQFFTLQVTTSCGTGSTRTLAYGADEEWVLEFVGDDKQHLRITVFDSLGYDWDEDGGTDNPVMQSQSMYTLTFDANEGPNVLVDSLGNVAEDGDPVVVRFYTEDITGPNVAISNMVCDGVADEVDFKVTLTDPVCPGTKEAGTFNWALVQVKGGKVLDSGSATTDANGVKTITGADASGLVFGSYVDASDYEVKVVITDAADDEDDFFALESNILNQWPFKSTDPGFMGYDGYEEEITRIQDIISAPNVSAGQNDSDNCTLCDDDAPVLLSTYPNAAGILGGNVVMDFPLTDSIVLTFNETVVVNDDDLQGYSIWLRDSTNNLGVPLAWTVTGTNSNIVTLYPIDTALIGSGDPFAPYVSQPRATLKSQHQYYIEIDRYAISDDGGCNSDSSYVEEVVGQEDWWFETEDATPPCLVSVWPANDTTCVDENSNIELVFTEMNGLDFVPCGNVDSNFIYIYRVGDIVPHERIPMAMSTPVEGPAGTWTVSIETHYQFLSDTWYEIIIPGILGAQGVGGRYVDDYGNMNTWACDETLGTETGNGGFKWQFKVRDYVNPIPTATVYEHLSYLEVALRDDEYVPNEYITDMPGETVGDGDDIPDGDGGPIATSSYVKIKFDEEVFVKQTNGTTYIPLDEALTNSAYTDDLYAALKVTYQPSDESAAPVALDPRVKTSGSNYTGQHDDKEFSITAVGPTWVEIEVYHAPEHWSPGLTDEVDYGFRSNAKYVFSVHQETAGILWDDRDLCDPTLRAPVDAQDVVTVITRDDTAPTLTISDPRGDVCTPDCDSYGPGEGKPCRSCVESWGPITLTFSSPVVQTPYVGIDYDSIDWESQSVNWWSEANLPLTEAHLIDAGPAHEFMELMEVFPTWDATTGELTSLTYGDSVLISQIEIIDNKIFNIIPAEELISEGYYQIVFRGGTVKDQMRIPNGNVFMGDSCIFQVEEHMDVVATPMDPANGTTVPAPTTDELVISFNQKVKVNGDMMLPIELRRLNGQIKELIYVNECVLATDGMSLTLPLDSVLENFMTYYVIVPEELVYADNACNNETVGEAFYSNAINPDEGGYMEWYFMTEDGTPPTGIVYIPNDERDPATGIIINRNIDVPRESNLSIIFDENIDTLNSCEGAGLFIYYNDGLDGFTEGTDFGNFIEFIPYSAAIEISGTDEYDGLVSDKITFDPETTFDRNGYYTIRATGAVEGADCGIYDLAGNPWVGIGDTITWSFTITNDVEPVLATTDPEYNHPAEAATLCIDDVEYGKVFADLTMTFDDGAGVPVMVAPHDVENAGMDDNEVEGHEIHIYEYIYDPVTFTYREELWTSFDIMDTENVEFVDNTITLKNVELRDDIDENEFYYVTVESGAVKNALPGTTSFWTGIDNAFVWRFKTCKDDVFVDDPTSGLNESIEIMAPVGRELKNNNYYVGETEVDEIKVSFSEGIESLVAVDGMVVVDDAGTTVAQGMVVVTDSITGEQVASFVVDTDLPYVSINNDTCLLITGLTDSLYDEATFKVTIQANALGDTSTVSTPNSTEFSWYFHVGDNTAPVANVLPAEDCQEKDIILTLTYHESKGVKPGTGKVMLKWVDDEGADQMMEGVALEENIVFNAADSTAVVSVPFTDLPDTTVFTVDVEAGFVTDNGAYNLPNAAVTLVDHFSTADNTAPTAMVEVIASEDAREIDGVMNHTNDVTIKITFDEPVDSVAGSIITFTNGVNNVDVNVGMFATEDDMVFTYTLTELEDQTTYSFSIAEELFFDKEACDPNPWVGYEGTSFVIGDNTPAEITETTPMDVIYGDYADLPDFMITVDDAGVVAGAGNITIYNAADDSKVAEFAASAVTRTEDADNAYFTFTSGVMEYGHFYVVVDNNAFEDATATLLGEPVEGIAAGAWTFAVIDSIAPVLEDWTPEDDGDLVATDTMLTMTFSEEVIDGAGFVYLYLHPDSLVATLSTADEIVQEGVQWKVRYYLDGILEETSRYIVELDTNFVTDRAGNALIDGEFDPVDDPTAWNFETLDETAPVVEILAPAGELFGIEGQTVTVESDEACTVYLVPEGYTGDLESAVTGTNPVGVKGKVLEDGSTVVLSVAGLAGEYVAYGIDATGNVSDMSNAVTVKKVDLVTVADIKTDVDNKYEYVLVAGEVTAVSETTGDRGFFFQDDNVANSGIFVLDESNDSELNRGGVAMILAKVVNETNRKVLDFESIHDFVADNFDATPVKLASSASLNGDYESMLVEFVGYRGDATDATTNQTKLWQTTTESITVDDFFGYVKNDYDAETWYGVVGVAVDLGTFTINPRDAKDITTLTGGIEDFTVGSYKVFPNPFVDYINVKVVSGKEVERVVLMNIAGQRIMDVTNNIDRIPTSELRSGVYLIQLYTEDGIAKTERIIKR